ncbi:MAG: outer membrane beta-barrel protein [Candidatus Aminicenantes bacterium]|nr:outer membrane beta-barrel protein [Candidatus Aminicenantes bacterium]
MKKRILLFIFIFSIWFMFFSFLLAQDKATVKVDRANIRHQPDRQSPVIIVVTKGTTLDIIGKEGEWYKISFVSKEKGKITGYIHQDLVELIKAEETKISEMKKELKKAEPVIPAEKVPIQKKQDRGKLRALGIKIGYSGASLYGENVEEFEEFLQDEMNTKGGLNFGGFIIVNFYNFLALHSELNYIQKGARTEGEVIGEKFKAWINLTYLEIPALARIYLPTQNDFSFSFYTGPYVSLKLSGQAKAQVGQVKVEEDIENLKSTDAGWILGASFDFFLPFVQTGRFSLDLRYSLGLTTISTETGVDTKNRVFSLSLAYLF